jgi:pyrroloquinoline quinone biosynthesis protein D
MTELADNARPQLADKARLKWDAVRKKYLLLFPEGVLVLNNTAHDVLALCDGSRDIAEIVKNLRELYHADGIDGDVKEILRRLVEKNLVKLAG